MLSRVSRTTSHGLMSMSASVSTAVSRMSAPLLSAAPLAMPAVAAPVSAAMALCTAPVRAFHASRPVLGLEEFFANQQPGNVGTSWSCAQLRNKSFEDLRKLWFVLLKEKNMLLTYRQHCRQTSSRMQNPERLPLVRKSMANIKVVIDERSHAYKMEISPRYARSCVKSAEARDAAKAKKAAAVPVVTREMKLNTNNPDLRRRVKFSGFRPTSATAQEKLAYRDTVARDPRSFARFEKRQAAKAPASAEPVVE